MIPELHTGNYSPENENKLVFIMKINFKILIKHQLGPARRAMISIMFGYLFFSVLAQYFNPEHPSFFPSTKV